MSNALSLSTHYRAYNNGYVERFMQKVCFVGDFFKNVAMSTNLSGESPLTENGSVLNSSANAGQNTGRI